MRKRMMLVAGILLWAGPAVFGQATLPAFHSGSWSNAFLPTGWTQTGINDYGSNYDGVGGNAAKFGDSGDAIQIYFSGAPSTVSYYIKNNTLSGAYVYKIQESSNGSTWTDASVFTSTNNAVPTTTTKYTNNLLSSSRYVKFLYVTKVGGGVGIDGVTISGPGVPAVTFNPAGSQSVAASNTLTLAVSIAPSGAGMQSWSLLPAYAGSASLSGGTFQFTPANSDSNKTFTLSVIATNSVGTSTGTVSIAVTAYVAPVPVITFSPAAPYSIMATYTQRLGVGVSPAGSGLSDWTFLPSNYAGSATLAGTNFTFTSAQADGPGDYTLSVIATNSFGATTGTAAIAVTAYVPPPPPGAYICTFEDGTKTGYAATNVTLSNVVWNLDGILIGADALDLKIGSKAARLKYTDTDGFESMTSQSVFSNGISTIGLWYGPYGAHGTNAPTMAIEISTSLASGWVEVGEVNAGAVTALTYCSVDVYVGDPVYVRIRSKSGVNDKSANFDNLTISAYSAPPAPSAYDAFLLKYNVTPGDPGTAPGDDLDGDAYSNTNEFLSDKNPYDEAVHP